MPVSNVDTTVEEVEENVVTMDRRRGERREGDTEALDSSDTKTPRRKKQRRRHIDPTTCERDYNDKEIEFMRAMDDYKHASGRMFPTCSEVLEVIRGLGYYQLTEEQAAQLNLNPAAESTDAEIQDEEVEDEFADA